MRTGGEEAARANYYREQHQVSILETRLRLLNTARQLQNETDPKKRSELQEVLGKLRTRLEAFERQPKVVTPT